MFEQTQVVESASTSARPLAGQVALVTGGSSGIGRGIALSLAAAGADVVVNYVAGATAAESVREELAMHGVRALAIQADVAQESEVDAMFGRIGRELGALDIVVANAGLQRDSAIEHRGELEVYRADLVIVACGAIESAALLLRSTSDAHPHGLANANDQVGRYYMCHHNGALLAITSEPNDSAFQKTLALTDFYRGGPCSDLPLGAVQLMGGASHTSLRRSWLRTASRFRRSRPLPAASTSG